MINRSINYLTSSFKFKVAINLFLVYISWGSTFLGNKLTLQVVGPFFACGIRMFIAGLLLLIGIWICKNWKKPSLKDLFYASWMSIFMIVMASAFLVVGLQYISSGIGAIICATTPMTILVAGWIFANEPRPKPLQWIGLLGGFCGICILAYSQGNIANERFTSLTGIIWVLLATFGWSIGSLLTRHHTFKSKLSSLQSCGLLLFIGGLECIIIGFFNGEGYHIHLENLNISVLIAFSWMILGGSIIAYASYTWLLMHVSLPIAISYEYVVPVIAIFLGWLFLNEKIDLNIILGCILTIGSIFFVMLQKNN